MKQYIVIELGSSGNGLYASIVTSEEGINLVFDNIQEAQNEANQCQNGIIVQVF